MTHAYITDFKKAFNISLRNKGVCETCFWVGEIFQQFF